MPTMDDSKKSEFVGNPIWAMSEGHRIYTSKAVIDVLLSMGKRQHIRVIHVGKPTPGFRNEWVEKVTVPKKKPMDCAACGKSENCAKIPGPEGRHSEVWICKRCWKHRRNAGRLLRHPWPKRRSTTEVRVFVERE